MGWNSYNDSRDNALDTPWNHFALLAKLNIPWKIRTCGEILNGTAKPEKTIILIHALPGEGFLGKLNPLFSQHWVILQSVNPTHVLVHFGNNTIRQYTHEVFQRLYSGALPACAYEVGIGSTKLTWYQRAYAYLTGKFI